MADEKRPVKERLLSAVVDLQSYITHDVNADRCAACPRWDELQGAAVAAVDEIAALRAQLAERDAEVGRLTHDIERHIAIASQEADARIKAEVERDMALSRLASLEDEKNDYIEYVGDALGQDYDRESLWDAAQRILSERDRLRTALDRLIEYSEHLSDEQEPVIVEARAALKGEDAT